MTQQQILTYAFLPCLIATLVYLVIVITILNDLRKNSPELWEDLGRLPLLNSSIQNSLNVTKFLYFRRYRRLKVGRTRFLGDLALGLGTNVAIVILFALLIAGTGGGGLHFRIR